jgi:hypothetical protein
MPKPDGKPNDAAKMKVFAANRHVWVYYDDHVWDSK